MLVAWLIANISDLSAKDGKNPACGLHAHMHSCCVHDRSTRGNIREQNIFFSNIDRSTIRTVMDVEWCRRRSNGNWSTELLHCFPLFSIQSVTFELNGSFSLSLVYVFRDLWIYKISTAIHPTRNPGFDSTTHKNHVTLISSSCWAIERPLYSFRSCKLFVFIICFWLLLALMLLWKMDHWGGWSMMTMLIVTAGWKKLLRIESHI